MLQFTSRYSVQACFGADFLSDTSKKGDGSHLGAVNNWLSALKVGVRPVASFSGKGKLF